MAPQNYPGLAPQFHLLPFFSDLLPITADVRMDVQMLAEARQRMADKDTSRNDILVCGVCVRTCKDEDVYRKAIVGPG